MVGDAVGLMERVRRGDAGAFETLYDEYHRLVYGVALRVLSDAAGRRRRHASVFLKLWSNPASFVSGNFGAWIVRVARNRAFDVLRARAARPEDEIPRNAGRARLARRDGAGGHRTPNRFVTPSRNFQQEQRELIELGFFGGVTHHEIARRTGLPLGTVKTRIRSRIAPAAQRA